MLAESGDAWGDARVKVGVVVNEVVFETKAAISFEKAAISLRGFVKSVEAVPHLSAYFGLSKYKGIV